MANLRWHFKGKLLHFLFTASWLNKIPSFPSTLCRSTSDLCRSCKGKWMATCTGTMPYGQWIAILGCILVLLIVVWAEARRNHSLTLNVHPHSPSFVPVVFHFCSAHSNWSSILQKKNNSSRTNVSTLQQKVHGSKSILPPEFTAECIIFQVLKLIFQNFDAIVCHSLSIMYCQVVCISSINLAHTVSCILVKGAFLKPLSEKSLDNDLLAKRTLCAHVLVLTSFSGRILKSKMSSKTEKNNAMFECWRLQRDFWRLFAFIKYFRFHAHRTKRIAAQKLSLSISKLRVWNNSRSWPLEVQASKISLVFRMYGSHRFITDRTWSGSDWHHASQEKHFAYTCSWPFSWNSDCCVLPEGQKWGIHRQWYCHNKHQYFLGAQCSLKCC